MLRAPKVRALYVTDYLRPLCTNIKEGRYRDIRIKVTFLLFEAEIVRTKEQPNCIVFYCFLPFNPSIFHSAPTPSVRCIISEMLHPLFWSALNILNQCLLESKPTRRLGLEQCKLKKKMSWKYRVFTFWRTHLCTAFTIVHLPKQA